MSFWRPRGSPGFQYLLTHQAMVLFIGLFVIQNMKAESFFKVITIVMSGKRRWLKTSSTWSWGRWRQLERFSRNLQNAISGEYQLDNFIGYKSFIVISSSQKLLETLKSEKVREGYVSGRNKLPVKRNFGQDEEKEKLINMMEHISTTVDTLRVKRRSIKKLSSL